MNMHHDAQHLIPHLPEDTGCSDEPTVYCDDCGEPIAHTGAECLNCDENSRPT